MKVPSLLWRKKRGNTSREPRRVDDDDRAAIGRPTDRLVRLGRVDEVEELRQEGREPSLGGDVGRRGRPRVERERGGAAAAATAAEASYERFGRWEGH